MQYYVSIIDAILYFKTEVFKAYVDPTRFWALGAPAPAVSKRFLGNDKM